ncbi:hypothetical protein [Salinadaptatus halalkaliphilus]|uniref:hypothetical protein n=1 Tax=Salinadaptatus halalkaliphilus TaxID=2419781 RepID=UPI001FE8A1B0|nr:hypothetical protein [Salinadaptatus halalkaliphilus]
MSERPAATRWVRGLWSYYRAYTHTPAHTASAAALAIFGLLVFVDPIFAAVAIGSYLVPPIVLYVLADEQALENGKRADSDAAETHSDSEGIVDDAGDDDSDTDTDDGTDTDNSDTDTDSGDTDTDTDDG